MAAKKFSITIRIVAGTIGLLGVAAIGIAAIRAGSVELDAMFYLLLFAKLFAAWIFIYVALFGTNPLAFPGIDDE